jgi:hypothetical protein
MRKFILIAGFVLASATAHGADRSLSLGGIETQSAPAKAIDASKTAEAPQAATPKYTERPAIVEPKSEASKPEASKPEISRAETQRAARAQRASRIDQSAIERAKAERGRLAMQRTASMGRMTKPRFGRPSIKARIIYALHRYGIYW